MPSLVTLLLYILAGAVLGSLLLLTGIPAAPLLGAILGAGLLSISGQLDVASWPLGTKTVLGIGIGTVIGTGINRETLGELQLLWKPALLITFTLLITGILLGILISRFLGVDIRVALLGAAPGGTIGMSLVGAEFGVVAAVVALAFGLAAASFFPAIVMGIFYKQMNKEGAIAGMLVGISLMVYYMLKFKFNFFGGGSADDYWFGISPEGFGSVAMVVNFVISYIVMKFTSPTPEKIKKIVDNIRIPEHE
ncbi:MAG: hypothetical protein CMC61_00090 [Flavobacteriaceae bacterium]|nr:hypothetical protein [Flavobacteriaceae bacterium]